ncbi:TorF family putative porin [Acinetobacter sp.]|jgi:uncharacterized protein (TIGR02001 family)|uniref:TorF family putative porin n=1 Tax=Acinetobacter sp. TaxID=472 RepID=UPI002835D599|nr:TorF family putative porin [Acinetobacter sp.]MDR0237855.1 TorF family putative porin [Acinetobacter sp.]
MIKNTVILGVFASTIVSSLNAKMIENEILTDQFMVSGSLSFLTEYYWRGATQTQRKPAVQGVLRMDHDTGVYAQIFASNIQLGIGSSLEFDYFLGYNYSLNDHLKLNLQYLDVNYPGKDKTLPQVDFEEYSLGLSTTDLLSKGDQLNFSFYYSPDYTLETGKMLRYETAYHFPINEKWGAYAQIGYNQFSSFDAYARLWNIDNKKKFYDYKIGVDLSYQSFIFDLYYADANINKVLSSTDSTVVFSLSRIF